MKPLTEFYRNPQQKSGRDPSCKACKKTAAAQRYKRDRDAVLARNATWAAANRPRMRQHTATYRRVHADRHFVQRKNWRQRNPDLVQAQIAKRRAALVRAVVAWGDKEKIKAMYREAARLSRETGVRHDVDHVVPLRHPLVCGLHVEHNLRVIPRVENGAKSNRYWPGMSA